MNVKKRMAGVLLLWELLMTPVFWGCRDQTVYELTESAQTEEEEATAAKEAAVIYVHICGAVKKPGVYALEAGSRVAQAVEAAGGLTEEAREESLNQARLLTDGEQITVLTQEEAEESGYGQSASPETDGMININTADVSRLTDLNGIGETKAKAILEYREENGGFQSIEDICRVDGIGQGTFEKIKDRITVN